MSAEKGVFISWSGARSQQVASALKHWLPDVFQGLAVWMSDHDIQAGARWGREIGAELELCNFGIVCLTPENLKSHWLTFEAGALSKAVEESRVVPFRFQLRASDVGPPLSQFQGVDADCEGTRRLIVSLNEAMGRPLADDLKIQRTFEHWWPDLRDMFAKVELSEEGEIRSDRELLEEVLDIVRQSGLRDLNNVLGRVLLLPNVRRVEVAPKEVAGTTTNRLALKITVNQKLPLSQVPADQLIPTSIFGMPTDVVEA